MRAIKLLQRDPSKPTLRERFAAVKAKAAGLAPETSQGRRAMLAGSMAAALPLPALATAASASGEYAEIRARLLTAYAEDRAARPIVGNAKAWSIEDEASTLVLRRCDDICVEILALPAPQTHDGFSLLAVAAAIIWEADTVYNCQDRAALAVIRAMLALTGTTMPLGFTGFGDEPETMERDAALYAAAGSLPAWAIAEAEAADEADTPSPVALSIA